MTIQWRLNSENLLDAVELERVNAALKLLQLKDGVAIDSYEMSPNGPILTSLFVVSGPYFCEIRMGGKHLEFDLTPADLLLNYRVIFGEHVVPVEASGEGSGTSSSGERASAPEPQTKVTKFVTVELRHTDVMGSKMAYFGDSPEQWLQHVLKTYPVSLME
ncbi:hypothetical protein GCM10027399_24860 [Curvibacter fontanus]